MEFYTTKKSVSCEKTVAVDDMLLTKDMPTTAGSKMLDGYMSLFEAEAITKLEKSGYCVSGKAKVGEFAIDLLGETGFSGACIENGKILSSSAEIVKSDDVCALVALDVNGSVRRAAAQNGLISIKPTYGTVSRYGTIPVACSGETVSVLAKKSDTCIDILDVIKGHDDKDGTSLSDVQCAKLAKTAEFSPVKKVCVITSMFDGVNSDISDKLESFKKTLEASGVEVCERENDVIATAKIAWNILMSAELCNNVSRYDGVKYGYRAEKFSNIDELYTNSRTEAFGNLLKTAILFGSETLSTDNYMKVYDKALRVRRVICEEFTKLFSEFDAVIMPACSTLNYTEELVKGCPEISFEENFYTAPASITGLPAVVAGDMQIVGKAFSDRALLELAKLF